MKRILIGLLAMFMLLGTLAACGATPAETTPIPTTPAPTTPAPTTPAPTTPAPTTPATTTPAATDPVLVPDFSACVVSPRFFCLADLETYMKTGSTDAADYLKAPTRLDVMPSLKEVAADGGYLSLGDLFGIDGSNFDCSEILVYRGSPFGMRIDYHFDQVSVSIANTRTASISQEMSSGSVPTTDIVLAEDLSAPLPIENGYISHTTNGVEIIYQVKDGVKIDVRFVYDGFCVIVRAARWYSEDITAEMDSFMQNAAFEDVHALFANDNQQVSSAIAAVKSGIEGRADIAQ